MTALLSSIVKAMDRPGRVFVYFGGLALLYAGLDALFVASATGATFLEAFFSPPRYDLFTRALVAVLAFVTAAIGEIVLTRYRRTARELTTERARLQALYEDNPSAIVVLGRDFEVSYANRRAESIVGRPRSELEGQPCYQAFVGKDSPCEGCLVSQVVETGKPHSNMKHETTVAGRENWLSQMWYPLFDANGDVESIVEIANDVSELRLDPLTGLPNRLLLRDRLDVALASAQRHGRSLGVLFLDIDEFKSVNDDYGHAAGDALLTAFAARMRGAVRQDETLARMSGDEFVLLIPTLEDPEDVEHVARRVIEQLREPFVISGSTLPVTVSVGACVYEGGDVSAADVLRSADASMYVAKEAGGNAFHVGSCNPID